MIDRRKSGSEVRQEPNWVEVSVGVIESTVLGGNVHGGDWWCGLVRVQCRLMCGGMVLVRA